MVSGLNTDGATEVEPHTIPLPQLWQWPSHSLPGNGAQIWVCIRTSQLEGLLKCRWLASTSRVPDSAGLGGAWECACLTSSWVMLRLLVQGPQMQEALLCGLPTTLRAASPNACNEPQETRRCKSLDRSLLSHKCNMFILFLQCLCNHPIFLLRFLFFTGNKWSHINLNFFSGEVLCRFRLDRFTRKWRRV